MRPIHIISLSSTLSTPQSSVLMQCSYCSSVCTQEPTFMNFAGTSSLSDLRLMKSNLTLFGSPFSLNDTSPLAPFRNSRLRICSISTPFVATPMSALRHQCPIRSGTPWRWSARYLAPDTADSTASNANTAALCKTSIFSTSGHMVVFSKSTLEEAYSAISALPICVWMSDTCTATRPTSSSRRYSPFSVSHVVTHSAPSTSHSSVHRASPSCGVTSCRKKLSVTHSVPSHTQLNFVMRKYA